MPSNIAYKVVLNMMSQIKSNIGFSYTALISIHNWLKGSGWVGVGVV